MRLLLITILGMIIFSCSPQQDTEEKAIAEVMIKQQESWNKGDVDGFMESYWKDDSLKFIGKKGINYGWQTTLDNYKESYPSTDAMGKLEFTLIDVNVYTATDAYVLGKWALERKDMENLGGYFTLIWKKIDGDWVIVTDHTS